MYTKEHLQSTIEELETSNEELQSTNEELVASNEELQSTNEELHSVNEELYTVNAEHQRKIEELTQLTSDMDNLLGSTDIGTIFLDLDLHIRKFTPSIASLFNLLPLDVGRPLQHISSNLDIGTEMLMAMIDKMHLDGKPIEQEVEGPDKRTFLIRALPYRQQNAQIVGTVLTFVDITAVKQVRQELGASRRRLDAVLDIGDIGTWDWDVTQNKVVLGNNLNKFLNLNDRGSEATYDKFLESIHPADRDKFKSAVTKALHQNVPFAFENRFVLPNGTERSFITRADVHRDRDGKPVRMTGVCIDVSARKQMELALHESEQRFRAVVDNSSAIIFVKDLEGAIPLSIGNFPR